MMTRTVEMARLWPMPGDCWSAPKCSSYPIFVDQMWLREGHKGEPLSMIHYRPMVPGLPGNTLPLEDFLRIIADATPVRIFEETELQKEMEGL